MVNQNRTRSLFMLFGLMIVPLIILLATFSLASAGDPGNLATSGNPATSLEIAGSQVAGLEVAGLEVAGVAAGSEVAGVVAGYTAPSMIDGPSCRNGVSG